MFQRLIETRSLAILRIAAMALVGGVSLILTTGPVSAQSFGDGWVGGSADCRLATHVAAVSVQVMEPKVYASSGLYFYSQVYAKARNATKYGLVGDGYSPLVKTWSQDGANRPTTIFSGSFTGNYDAYYDIHVMYWYAPPGAARWTGPSWFNLKGDPDSHIYATSTAFGSSSSEVSDCYLGR